LICSVKPLSVLGGQCGRVERMAKKTVKSTSDSTGKTPKRIIDWKELPFGVIIGRSPKCRANFKNAEDALAWVEKLPIEQQAQAFVGQFFPVKVTTKAKL